MNVLEQVMEANHRFTGKLPAKFCKSAPRPSKTPLRHLAIFTCMDTRLVDFLEPALGLKREDAVVIKNAGNSVTGPFEATIRSLIIAIFELGVKEILVIGHEDCGAAHSNTQSLTAKMLARGISPDAISMVEEELSLWLDGFHHPVDNVVQVVQKIRANPLIPNDVPVHGLIFEPHSGEVKVVSDGYS